MQIWTDTWTNSCLGTETRINVVLLALEISLNYKFNMFVREDHPKKTGDCEEFRGRENTQECYLLLWEVPGFPLLHLFSCHVEFQCELYYFKEFDGVCKTSCCLPLDAFCSFPSADVALKYLQILYHILSWKKLHCEILSNQGSCDDAIDVDHEASQVLYCAYVSESSPDCNIG